MIPRRLRRAHVAAALDITPNQATHLLSCGKLETVQYEPGSWRETTPEALMLYAARMGLSIDWEAVLEQEAELKS